MYNVVEDTELKVMLQASVRPKDILDREEVKPDFLDIMRDLHMPVDEEVVPDAAGLSAVVPTSDSRQRSCLAMVPMWTNLATYVSEDANSRTLQELQNVERLQKHVENNSRRKLGRSFGIMRGMPASTHATS